MLNLTDPNARHGGLFSGLVVTLEPTVYSATLTGSVGSVLWQTLSSAVQAVISTVQKAIGYKHSLGRSPVLNVSLAPPSLFSVLQLRVSAVDVKWIG